MSLLDGLLDLGRLNSDQAGDRNRLEGVGPPARTSDVGNQMLTTPSFKNFGKDSGNGGGKKRVPPEHLRPPRQAAISIGPGFADVRLVNLEASNETSAKASLKVITGRPSAIDSLSRNYSESGMKLCHGNIKSSNILLTPDLHSLVSDYGVSQLIGCPTSPHQLAFSAYFAPEFIHAMKCSHEADVYGFGVVLLETLTGRSPIRAPGGDEIADLPKWVQSVVREEWTAEVFDVELMRCPNIEEEMVGMLQIALSCTANEPRERPRIEEVVRMIEDLRRTESDRSPFDG